MDDDIDVEDWDRVWWALSVRFDPVRCAQIINRGRASPVDPSLPKETRFIMSRIILDATTPYEWTDRPREVVMDEKMMKKVSDQWKKYGFKGDSPIVAKYV